MFYVKHNQKGLADYVYKRENGRCQKCGWKNPTFDLPEPKKPGYQQNYAIYKQKKAEYDKAHDQYIEARNKWLQKTKNAERRKFVADHIVPIALGGEEFDPDNVQNLCEVCNKKKTKKDQGKIARKRRLIKNVGKNSSTLPETNNTVNLA